MKIKGIFGRRKAEETRVEYIQGENHSITIVTHHPGGKTTRVIAHTVPPETVHSK